MKDLKRLGFDPQIEVPVPNITVSNNRCSRTDDPASNGNTA
jgi:hypothetical protein